DFAAFSKTAIECAARGVAGQCEIKTAARNVGIEINCAGNDDLAVRLDHDSAGCGKVAAKAGRERATIAETRVRLSVAAIARQGEHAWRAAGTAELCKPRDDDAAIRLNSNGADRIDVAKKIGRDLTVLTKAFIERAVRVVARHDKVFDGFRIAEARTCGNDLPIRLDGHGVRLIDISGEVGSNDAARPEALVEIAGRSLCLSHYRDTDS